MTLGAVCLTAALQFVQNQSWGYRFVQDIGSVRAEDPLWLALLRTPLSLFVPALDLPVWGALAQILLVFGIAGDLPRPVAARSSSRTSPPSPAPSTRAWASRSAPTARSGCPRSDRLVVDTGPSAAVVGLAVFVCWRYRAPCTAVVVVAAHGGRGRCSRTNLAGKEHLAAIARSLLVCAGSSAWRHRAPSAAGATGSGPVCRRSGPESLRLGPDQRRSWW